MSKILEIDKPLFSQRTNIEIADNISDIVSLKDLDHITHIEIMPEKTLDQLLRNIPLHGDGETKPYKDAKIQLYGIDPTRLYVSQRFVKEEKVLNILSLSELFDGFHVPGISDMPPLMVYGKCEEKDVLAFYIPPIIESFDGSFVILDGTHRSYAAKGVGTTMNYVVITKDSSDLPITPTTWDCVKLVKEKPPKAERYFNLKPYFFRRLDYVGIDG